MNITEPEKRWILANKKVLKALFNRRVEELKDQIFDEGITTDEEKNARDLKIHFVHEFKEWLILIDILESDKENPKEKKKEDTFI